MINPLLRVSLYVLVFSTFLTLGCATFAKQSDFEAQNERLKKVEDEQRKALDEASRVLRRNSADQGVQIEELNQRVAELEGKLNESQQSAHSSDQAKLDDLQKIKTRLDEISRSANVDFVLDPTLAPRDKKAHYSAGQDALRVRDFAYGRALLREYVRRYANDDLADDAVYAIGKSYLQQGKPARALDEFRSIISAYKKSNVMDQTLFDMAEAFYQVRACKDAETALSALIKQHKKSELVPDAQKKLKDLASSPTSACSD